MAAVTPATLKPIVAVPATVPLVNVAVYVPFPLSVTALIAPSVVVTTIVLPPVVRLFPPTSFACTVIVDVVAPFATILVGDADMVEPVEAVEIAPAFTVKVLLVIVAEPDVAVIVFKVPACVTVKLCAPVVPFVSVTEVGEMVPAFVLMVTAPLALLPNWSVPVIVAEKAVAATCGLEIELILSVFAAPATCAKLPQLAPVANPEIVVPPDALVILPGCVPVERFPKLAFTCMPATVMELVAKVEAKLAAKDTEIVVLFVTVAEPLLIPVAVLLNVSVAPVLNVHPDGADIVKVFVV